MHSRGPTPSTCRSRRLCRLWFGRLCCPSREYRTRDLDNGIRIILGDVDKLRIDDDWDRDRRDTSLNSGRLNLEDNVLVVGPCLCLSGDGVRSEDVGICIYARVGRYWDRETFTRF